jgi:hypothetical protein
MRTVQLNKSRAKYSLIESDLDLTSFPLNGNLFGLNNKIYCNLGSYSNIEKGTINYKNYLKIFTEQELRFNCVNRLLEVRLTGRRNDDDEYEDIGNMDFKSLYDFVNDEANITKYSSLHMSYYDDDDEEAEKTILYLPLASDVFKNAANYAFQEIEKIKLDNFMNNFEDSEKVNRFLNTFSL